MISDNLASLFDQGQPGVRFRQGTVTAWDSSTGQNTIDLAGGTLTDVPILNTGEAIALKAGHIVGLLGQGSTWFIIGRVTPPNSADFAGASVAFAYDFNNTSNFAVPLSPTFATVATAVLPVPAWADEALVQCMVSFSLHNTRAVPDFANGRAAIGGTAFAQSVSGFAATGAADVGDYDNLSCLATRIITSPGSTITVSAQVAAGGGAWAADTNNLCSLAASAVFRSIT